jgi:hypothetical protein
LHDIVGQTHSSVGYKYLQYPSLPHPIQQEECGYDGQHKAEVIPGIENGYGNEYYFLCGNADILYRCKKLKRRIINIFPVFDRRGFFELS